MREKKHDQHILYGKNIFQLKIKLSVISQLFTPEKAAFLQPWSLAVCKKGWTFVLSLTLLFIFQQDFGQTP